jgi:glycosyltransferase involved in cell wall biosynthesis
MLSVWSAKSRKRHHYRRGDWRTSIILNERPATRRWEPVPAGGGICVLSRQRITGRRSGSSAYLLSLCEALRGDGHALHLVCPSPAVFGRWPALAMGQDMALFSSIAVRGALRLGYLYVALDPAVWGRALVGALGLVAARMGRPVRAWSKPAAYSVAVPWRPADLRFVARHAPRGAAGILADYAFLTAGIDAVVDAAGPSAVVMHDLFSTRPAEFGPLGGDFEANRVDVDAEMAMLDRADAVIAIQAEEAAFVRHHLPDKTVFVAPMAVAAVAAPQPGDGEAVLFVGSNTSANVDAVRWLFADIWPAIRGARGTAHLHVVGDVARSFPTAPAGVTLHGRVDDLAAFYAAAGVVVSPLRGGSGLKVKLIEALGHGKAVVATPTTLQGVADIAGPAVVVADDAADFAAAVVALLADPAARCDHGARALAVVRDHFSPAACYAEVVAFFRRGRDR